MKKFFLSLALLSSVAMLAGCLPAKEEPTTEDAVTGEEVVVTPEEGATTGEVVVTPEEGTTAEVEVK